MTDENFLVATDEYLKAGIHIGTKFKTKYMSNFIYKTRPDGLSVLNLQKIDERIKLAANFLARYEPQDILVVGRRESAWKPIRLFGKVTGTMVFPGRYPPGILTNPRLENYIEVKIVLTVDAWADRNAVVDAVKIGIPVVSLCDTNNQSNNNVQYLKGVLLPTTIRATANMEDALKNATIVIIAVPSDYVRATVKACAPALPTTAVIMHVVKGVEAHSGKVISQVIHEELPNHELAVLSGPNHAEEVARKLPTATVIASTNQHTAKNLCELFTLSYFKAYPHHDVLGVELCGVIKNIVAIAMGICDGLQVGDNAKGSILTLGLTEMSMLCSQLGAKKATCFGLAGVGDLVASCYSEHGRNRLVGKMLAKGKSVEHIVNEMNGMVAEGIKNTATVHKLCSSNGLHPPLITQVYKVLYEKTDLKEAIQQLLHSV